MAVGSCHANSTCHHPQRGMQGGGEKWKPGSDQRVVTPLWPQHGGGVVGAGVDPYGCNYPRKGQSSWAGGR